MKKPINIKHAYELAEKLKLVVLNEPEMEVRIAVERLKILLNTPKFFASDYEEM